MPWSIRNHGPAATGESDVTAPAIVRIGALRDVVHFRECLDSLGLSIPCDRDLISGSHSTLAEPLILGDIRLGNRIAIQPMEGWDGTLAGNPPESTIRR